MITIITKRPHRTIDVEHYGVTKYIDKSSGKEVYKLYATTKFVAESLGSLIKLENGESKVSTVFKEREITLGRFNTEEEAVAIKEGIDKAVDGGATTYRLQ